MTSQLWWYTARAGGIVAWVLLAASMIWGLTMSTKPLGRRPRPNWMLDLHRFLGGAALVFVGIHVASIMLDSYVDFGVLEVAVPFTSTWNPNAVAWGIVATYLLVAVEITSLLRRKISKRAWRLTHFLSFPVFALATVHELTAGTDQSALPLRLVTAAATVVIVALTALRIAKLDRSGPSAPRVPRPVPPMTTATTATAGVGAPPAGMAHVTDRVTTPA
jgi:DMSO/TMAO reductase YedYZ heme-binding membrane subunit